MVAFLQTYGVGLSLAVSVMALFVAALNARVPKIDSEFNICITMLKRSVDLWEEYSCPKDETIDTEKFLLKIMNNAEWAFIYINSRGHFLRRYIFKSEPLEHLEEEILEPFVRCLRLHNDSSDYLRRLFKDHATGQKTFAALKRGLKRKGIKI